MKSIKSKLLLACTVFTVILFSWSLFGSFTVDKVIGYECGPQTVTPCIEQSITQEVDVLEEYRTYVASAAGILLLASLILFLKAKKASSSKA